MIQSEVITINGVNSLRTYSDDNRYVVRDGVEYYEAIDPIDSVRTYTEGNLIEGGNDAEEILNILTGESE